MQLKLMLVCKKCELVLALIPKAMPTLSGLNHLLLIALEFGSVGINILGRNCVRRFSFQQCYLGHGVISLYVGLVVLQCIIIRKNIHLDHDAMNMRVVQVRDLMSWMCDMEETICSEEPALSVSGAEALISKHNQHKAEIDTRRVSVTSFQGREEADPTVTLRHYGGVFCQHYDCVYEWEEY